MLLEGVPGLGKTLLIKSLSYALGLSFKRVQFTPDLMPSDIIGTQVLMEVDGHREFQFKKGPIFAQIVLADEINRATPKTQSAVLEADGGAAGNRFRSNLSSGLSFHDFGHTEPHRTGRDLSPSRGSAGPFLFQARGLASFQGELKEILRRTTGVATHQTTSVISEAQRDHLEEMQHLLRQVLIAPPLEDYVVSLVQATQPVSHGGASPISEIQNYLRFGASPRGAQAMILGAKANALMDGRVHVSHEDIESVIYPSLRHRLILNFQAEADSVDADQIISAVLKKVPRDKGR